MQTAFQDTARAFDTHALHYDDIVEPNVLLETMRRALWAQVARCVPAPAELLDLGCGTGIDAAHFAKSGYQVTAVDVSGEMVNQTRQRVMNAGMAERVRTLNMGAQELDKLGQEKFDAIYSDLGPLNCVPDLGAVAQQCAAHLKPNGYLILSVMGRVCPWEMLYYGLRGQFKEAKRRLPREMVPVNLEDGIVWTRYYSPQEFRQFFAIEFRLVTYRALNLFLPPPYLIRWYRRAGALTRPLAWLDSHVTSFPVLRDAGDHFLMTLRKRGEQPA